MAQSNIIGPSRGLDAPTIGGKTDGQFNFNLDFKNGAQALPDPVLSGDGQYDFAGELGEKELLGQGTTDEGTIHDDEYPTNIPNPTLPGDTIAGEGNTVGGDVTWGSVAPYKYPEYPMQSGHTGLAEDHAAIGG